MQYTKKTLTVLFTTALLLAPIAFILLPSAGVVQAAGQSRAPNVIGTTLAFLNGNPVTVQYSNIYFCNSSGPATPATPPSPCMVGVDATTDPVPDHASNTLDVIVPAFLPPICGTLGITCLSGSDLVARGFTAGTGGGLGSGFANTVLDSSLGANNLTQCPDNPSTLTCPNHPNFLDLSPTFSILGLTVIPLPIHTHVLSGPSGTGQGGWWKLIVWLVLDPSIWPNPNTGACSAGSGCLTSHSALTGASSSQVFGPVPTTIYLFFNVVSSSAR